MARAPFLALLLLFALLFAPATSATEAEAADSSEDAGATLQKITAIKSGLTKEQAKIHSSLWPDATVSKDSVLNKMLANSVEGTRLTPEDEETSDRIVKVEIRGEISKGLLKTLKNVGAEVSYVNEEFGSLVASVRGSALQELAAFPGVRSISPLQPPIAFKDNTSQGVGSHRVNLAKTKFPQITGAGVKVGVISDSVNFLEEVQESGDLPNSVTVLADTDASGEGTAMLEIVHDMAPGAKLYYATSYPTEAAFASNIIALANAGCKVIVDDIIYLAEPVYSDGPVARAVDTVTARGVSYFSSAGNYGSTTLGTSHIYEGDYVSTTWNAAAATDYIDVHQFGNSNHLTVGVGAGSLTVFLHWADNFEDPEADYDLFITNAAGGILGTSLSANSAVEGASLNFGGSGTIFIYVARYSGSKRMLSVRLFSRGFSPNMSVSSKGMIYGHAAARGCMAIAAVEALSPPNSFFEEDDLEPESFTSQGPRRVFYNGASTVITPGVFTSAGGSLRKKPDFAAADGVSTATPGFNPFYGTSAAAPHAAALAALALSANPNLTPRDIYFLFQSSAKDMLTAGWDDVTGHGILDAVAILESPCLNAPCQNGGCLKSSPTTFVCSCDEGFIGDLCEISPASRLGWNVSWVILTVALAAYLTLY